MNVQYKLTLSYEGTLYFGWQKTQEGPSIEQTLQLVLATILQEPIELQAASRTDAGVHALGQVVTFVCSKALCTKKILVSLNQLLPSSIRCLDIEKISLDFHPTLSSFSKSYRYVVATQPILSPFEHGLVWHFPHDCQIPIMESAAKQLIGTHDFKAFTNQKKGPHKDTVRTLFSIDIQPTDSGFFIDITGDHFLYKMVRNIVGTLCYIGAGKISLSALSTILKNKQRTQAGITAPASGLFLKNINYTTFCKEQ